MDKEILGRRIEKLRDDAGMSQQALADKCGWRKNRIWNYENGERTPSVQDLGIIATAFQSHYGHDAIFYLFTGKKIPEFLSETNYKTPYVSFTPQMAVSALNEVIDTAQEFGIVNFSKKEKVCEFITAFAKKCKEAVIPSESLQSL